MAFLLVLLLSVLVPRCLSQDAGNNQSPSIQLLPEPQQIIPGLTQQLRLTCCPGQLASEYREVHVIQIFKEEDGVQRPFALLVKNYDPVVAVDDPRITASGHLNISSNVTSDSPCLQVFVAKPTSLDAGEMSCSVLGLSHTGNQEMNSQSLNITVHPDSHMVDTVLKEMVADLKNEAESLMAHTHALQEENQKLRALAAAKQAAVVKKQQDLQDLKTKVQILKQTVADRQDSLNLTAQELVEKIANVSQDAPPMRVSFNAVEKTERVYASGQKILFETVEMNEGSGYNRSTSSFRPPVAGVYYLTSAQLAHDRGSASTRAYSIRRNTTVVGSAYNADDRQSSTFKQSSTSTIVSLTPFDIVTVYQQYSTSSTVDLSPYSNTVDGVSTNFAGYLVY